jgi:hypothetical protein
MTKAHHIVLGYEMMLGNEVRFKTEAYYQSIGNVPIERRITSYSILNEGANFNYPDTDSLINKGKGYNYGLELTLEQSLNKGTYYLLTASLFESQAQGSDGVWRNTAFNGNYIVNALTGKEFKIGREGKNAIFIDLKGTIAGGRRYTPVDVAVSIAKGEAVYKENEAFSKQTKAYRRLDLKFGYRMNGKRITQEFQLDIQNVLNTQNVFSYSWDAEKQRMTTVYQLGIFPVPQYRITF